MIRVKVRSIIINPNQFFQTIVQNKTTRQDGKEKRRGRETIKKEKKKTTNNQVDNIRQQSPSSRPETINAHIVAVAAGD